MTNLLFRLVCVVAVSVTTSESGGVQPQWVAQAPGPNTRGQVESVDEGEVVGAINAVAIHPTNPNIVFVGAVNGGVWRTDNAMDARPSWRPLTDAQPSQSIGAIDIDPTDASGSTLVVGIGRFSSMRRNGGERTGIIRSTDGGKTWAALNGGGAISGLNIAGVIARGLTIVLCANDADTFSKVGLWRSVDTGATWGRLSGASGTGLPSGPSTDLAADSSMANRLFTVVGGRGVYRSVDKGATWHKVSTSAMDALIANAENAKLSVGTSSNVFVAVVVNRVLAGVFRSPNAGTTWQAMALPATSEGGAHVGQQGAIHLSIAADRTNPQVVYLGGDRQPSQVVNGAETWHFPNSIGAQDYSGRLFRGDASKSPASQWVHLTHSNTLGAAGGGTAHNSAPHADSRDLAMAPNGVLLETDDGGIYKRTSPLTNTGDWFSMIGDIQATEFHSVAWDSTVHLVIGGAQDTGTPQQRLRSDVRWQSVTTGDGGEVAVDGISTPGQSTRYSSYQNFDDFRRDIYDASNVFQGRVRPALTVVGGGSALSPYFYTPFRLNQVTPTRLIIGAANGVYESMNQGDTIQEVGPGIAVNETGPQIIAYGATDNADVLYVGSDSRVFVRRGAPPAGLTQADAYPGGNVVGIALTPASASTAFVIDASRVFRSTDFGQTWTEVTGNLQQLAPGEFRSVTYVTATAAGSVVVGTDRGVFTSSGPAFATWNPMTGGLPAVPVYHLEYNAADRVLLAGTLGRGAWTLTFAAAGPGPIPAPPPTVAAVISAAAVDGQPGQTANPERVVELRPGVLVDLDRREAYMMTPEGTTAAVRLNDGTAVWTSTSAAKPLAVAGERLVAQAETQAGNVLRIVVLAVTDGRPLVTADSPMPAGVRASIAETVNGTFAAGARVIGAEPIVSWDFQERLRQGIPPETRSAMPGSGGGLGPAAAPGTGGAGRRSGAFKVNLANGTLSPTDLPGPPPMMVPRTAEASVSTRIANLPVPQFLSADGRHVLVSETVDGSGPWDRYQLTVYDRASLQRIGAFRSHLAQVPFVVDGTQILFETGPYSRRAGETMIDEPLKLRAVDLRNGAELWSRPIRDTKARTPPPG